MVSDNTDQALFFAESTEDFLKEANSKVSLLRLPEGQQTLTTIDYANYLGVDLIMEPQLAWIPREMARSPLPPGIVMCVSKVTYLVYFKYIEESVKYTFEHPLFHRFRKVLEKSRLDLLCLRYKFRPIYNILSSTTDAVFNYNYLNLQIPCEDCHLTQAKFKCNICCLSLCEVCCPKWHSDGYNAKHELITTVVGSSCSRCASHKTGLKTYCTNCKQYFCLPCFEKIHSKGYRIDHKALVLNAVDGDVIISNNTSQCDHCMSMEPNVHCDECNDDLCLLCFWKLHLNGNRRNHSCTHLTFTPLCNRCDSSEIPRASVYCDQCEELFCSTCFANHHLKGNRSLHLFTDAINVLLLNERKDTLFTDVMKKTRESVLSSIQKIQALVKSWIYRKGYLRTRKLAISIQKNWRGFSGRRRIAPILDQYNWRRRKL